MYGSRKHPYLLHKEITRGRGVLKAERLEEKYEEKKKRRKNFLGGEGVQNKNPSMGKYGYFLELYNVSDVHVH